MIHNVGRINTISESSEGNHSSNGDAGEDLFTG